MQVLKGVELTTPENYSYYRAMLAELLQQRVVAKLSNVPSLDPASSITDHEKLVIMFLIDVGCKFSVFWQRCAVHVLPSMQGVILRPLRFTIVLHSRVGSRPVERCAASTVMNP